MSKFARTIAQIDLGLGIAFLLFAALGFSFRFARFQPTGIVFTGFGAVLVIIFLSARRQGYPNLGQVVTSYTSLKIPKEETMSNPMLSITLKSGLRDQVHILVENKEVVSSRWTFGRIRVYDLIVGDKKMKVELRRGAGGPRYKLYSDGELLSEGKFQSTT